MDGGIGPYPSSMAGSSVRPSSAITGTVIRTWARGDGTPPLTPCPPAAVARFAGPPAAPVPAVITGSAASAVVGEEPGGDDVGAELAEGPALIRSLQGAGGGGGPVPDPCGLVGGKVRGEPGHAVPVRGILHPPVGSAAGVAFFDADRMVPFPPGPGLVPEPAGDELTGRATCRIHRVGVQEMRLQRALPAGSRFTVSSTMILACCHEIVPACSAENVNGRAVARTCASPSRAPAVRSLTVRAHATSATTAISCPVWSSGDSAGPARACAAPAVTGGQPDFQGGTFRVQP